MILDNPILTTERFELWYPAATDLPDLMRLIDDQETLRYLGSAQPDAKSVWDRMLRNGGSWALYGYGTFHIRAKGTGSNGEVIANCGIFHSWRGFGKGMDDVPEGGWIVRRDWWGKGLATEVMDAVFEWFDQTHGPVRSVCMIEDNNGASIRVASLMGFERYDTQQMDEGREVTTIGLYERLP